MRGLAEVGAVQESLARCTVRGGFLRRFLGLLGTGNPALARALKDADTADQRQRLRQALMMMILHAKGSPMAATALDRIARAPEAKAMAVGPELHPYWLDSLIAAVAEFDPEFGPDLEKRWREVLGAALSDLAARLRER